MKTLVILQGAPASGKSTFIKEHNLESYTLSPDTIRLMLKGPEMTEDCMAIPAKENKTVFELFNRMLEYRMERGSFTVLDATHNRMESIGNYKKLAVKYGYRVYLVRFNVPLETLLSRNLSRKAIGRFVPEEAIRRHYNNIQAFEDRSWYTVISPEQFESCVYQRFEHLDKPVVHIGDIHGCYSALSQLEYDPNKQYVFLGDYFDRGIENGKVAKFLISWMKYPNVVFLYGNHERHLERYFKTGEFGTKQFHASMNDILASGVNPADLKAFFKRLTYLYCYEKDGKKVVCSHAGLPFMPTELRLLNPYDLSHGAGDYETDIDHMFQPEDKTIWQVHGHRNIKNFPAKAGPRSWNLNTSVEGGEPLRVLTLDKDWELNEFPCTVFNPMYSKACGPYWSMYNDKDVVAREYGDIISFNFSRETFWDKKWTETTTLARGMFCNKNNQTVLARGYEKFFTFKENEITSEKSIQNLQYPLTAYRKENGYLGLVGVHEGQLLFCSKSSVESDFAKWLKNIFMSTVNDPDAVLKYLTENNSCMAFEVVDTRNDPHIIEYESSKIVILDVFSRSFEFHRLPYEDLCQVGKQFGMEVKEKIQVMRDYEEFMKFYRDVSRFDYEEDGKKVEGYVLEDSSEKVFHFKVKSGFYKFWKIFRTAAERDKMNLDYLMRNCAYYHLNAEKPRMRQAMAIYQATEPKPTLFEMQSRLE